MSMKNILAAFLGSVLFVACAGNPPQWWNPGNRYGTPEQTPAVQTAAQRTMPAPKEEKLELRDESYEEITLTPMPDEDGENATGASASQNTELLPAGDVSLPVPSVLE